jgi:hypothetical protein
MILIAGIIGLVTLGLFFATLFLVVKEKDENGKFQMAGLIVPLLILIVGGGATLGVAVGYPKENPLSDLLNFENPAYALA